jgi:ribA/ribD-fused uncharacterized protein
MSRRPAGGRAPEGSVYIKAGLNTGYKRARSYGARWDESTQGESIAREFWPNREHQGCWYVPPGTSLDKFDEWEQTEPLFFGHGARPMASAPAPPLVSAPAGGITSCSMCGRTVPSANIALHELRCQGQGRGGSKGQGGGDLTGKKRKKKAQEDEKNTNHDEQPAAKRVAPAGAKRPPAAASAAPPCGTAAATGAAGAGPWAAPARTPVQVAQIAARVCGGRRARVLGFYSERKVNGCFSNFFEAHFTFELPRGLVPLGCAAADFPSPVGVETSEKAIMMAKAAAFGDSESYRQIASARTPHAAKQLGRGVRLFDEGRWQTIICHIAREVVWQKFSQLPLLRKRLLGTGSKILAEATRNDKIWGIGLNIDEDISVPARWKGTNVLGWALMQTRDRLRAEDAAADVNAVSASGKTVIRGGRKQGKKPAAPTQHEVIELSSDEDDDNAHKPAAAAAAAAGAGGSRPHPPLLAPTGADLLALQLGCSVQEAEFALGAANGNPAVAAGLVLDGLPASSGGGGSGGGASSSATSASAAAAASSGGGLVPSFGNSGMPWPATTL